MSVDKATHTTHWIVIYLLDSVIRLLNNPDCSTCNFLLQCQYVVKQKADENK